MQDFSATSWAAIDQCWSRLQQFYWDLDHYHYARIADYFSNDATLHRMGVPLTGIATIEAALRARNPNLATRHVLYTPVLAENSGKQLKLNGYMQVLRTATDPGSEVGAIPIERPWRLYDVHAEFVNLDSGWAMNKLLMDPIFEFVGGNEHRG